MRNLRIRAGDLLLRPWAAADAGALCRACQDPELHRWLTGLPWPYRAADARAFIAGPATEQLATGVAVPLGVFSGAGLVGSVALTAVDRIAGTAELGYWSASWARGHRVAERAGRALLEWAFGAAPGLSRVDWRATVGNHASRLTALRLGFTMIGERPGGGAGPDRWLASLLPGDLTAAGAEVPDPVRRSARTFGRPHPTLTAGPLTLRPPVLADLPGIVECRDDPESARWFGGPRPYTEADARRHVEVSVPGRWARGAEAVFAVTTGDPAYAGSVDLRVSPADPAVGEVGLVVSPRWRGRGLGAAAVREICRWGFAELGLDRVEWRAEVGNDASLRVAEKAGFTIEGLARQALRGGGGRRDCWVGSLVKGESS